MTEGAKCASGEEPLGMHVREPCREPENSIYMLNAEREMMEIVVDSQRYDC